MTERLRDLRHSAINDLRKTSQKLKNNQENATVFEMWGALHSPHFYIASEAERNVSHIGDLELFHRGYASSIGVKIDNIRIGSLLEFEFEDFDPKLVVGSIFPENATVKVELQPDLVRIVSSLGELDISYSTNRVRFQEKHPEYTELLQDLTDLQRSFAVGEILIWLNGELEKKLNVHSTA